MKDAYLILQNGAVFQGKSFGYECESVGELVFSTGMCGYLETLTDPSYFGQTVVQTFPLIGNYGVIPADFEGKSVVTGYVVREVCETPSNFRAEYSLREFLMQNKIPAICGVDTRALTAMIRTQGVMNAKISFEPKADLAALKGYSVKNAVSAVTCLKTYTENEEGKYRVALIDYGAKKNIVRELVRRNCRVDVFPATVKAEEIVGKYHGVMLSNGPGDPAENVEEIAEIRKLLGNIPLFGICLGHQLTALAAGAKTEKLKYGHRGVNQPVRDLVTGRTFITSQNHGYAVSADSVKRGQVRFVNANDQTVEGMDYPKDKAFTVQFHPEACAGPHDTAFLFDRFIDLMEKDYAER